jgi:hypothetical protein
MNIKEQFAIKALDIIKTTKEGVLKVIEVAQEQIPDIIQQLFVFKLDESVVCTSLLTFLLVALLVTWLNTYRS